MTERFDETQEDQHAAEDTSSPLPRVASGIAGLDAIIGGGLFQAGIYVIVGSPGAGKTILGNQICFHHVATGGRALYVTLLAETHARMLGQMRALGFFDGAVIGDALTYINGFTAIESEGFAGLLKLLRSTVREHRASLLVLDGLMSPVTFAKSSIDYKKFIHELQTWVGLIDCTVLFLTSSDREAYVQPEYTMVDGIFELKIDRPGMRVHRQLTVLKFRGSGYAEGSHPYAITNDGIVVYPRVEAYYHPPLPRKSPGERLSSGIAAFDDMLGGGFVAASTTLVLGPSGSGKTILGYHFLAAGAAAGEPGLCFGFFENPYEVAAKGDALSLGFSQHIERGLLTVRWHPPAEPILDALADQLLTAVRRQGIRRLFLDGLVGFKEAVHVERLAGFFAVLTGELAALGVTTLITEETDRLLVREIRMPFGGATLFDSLVLLRQVELEAELRRLIAVAKTRNSRHDRAFYHFEITDRGVVMGPRFAPSEDVPSGASDRSDRSSSRKEGRSRRRRE